MSHNPALDRQTLETLLDIMSVATRDLDRPVEIDRFAAHVRDALTIADRVDAGETVAMIDATRPLRRMLVEHTKWLGAGYEPVGEAAIAAALLRLAGMRP